MSVTASLLLSVALALRPDTALRIVNPHPVAVDATLTCGDVPHSIHLEAHALRDLGSDALCVNPTLDSALPLLTLETAGELEQRRIAADDTCPPTTMSAPLFACELGVATASVPLLDGATYAWSAEGATIAEGANSNRVKVNLGAIETAKLICVVTYGGCSTEATGIIAIRKPLLIHELKVPAETDAAKPVTISWTYEPGAAPNAQLLSGDAFAAPVVVPAEQRSYTFTPATNGTRSVQLQASYATSILAPARGRRRAVGATLATATQCPSVSSSKQISIRGCTLGTPQILTPADVEAGTTFLASVDAAAGDSVSWAVKNGTLLSPSYLHEIEVRADASASAVELSVVVTRGADCSGRTTRSLPVVTPAICSSSPPTAALSVVAQSCNTATIQATFVGTPPFRGTWFDLTPFETSTYTVTREVTKPATYTLSSFRDAICSGIVTAKAKVERVKPTVTLSTIGGTCLTPQTRLVATFTGTPPFHGYWADGEPFTTNEYRLERGNLSLRGWWVDRFYDAVCPNGGGEQSNSFNLYNPPRVEIAQKTECQYGPLGLAYIPVTFWDGFPPLKVEWSDGVVTTSNTLGYLTRTINTSLPLAEVHIVKASSGTCDNATILQGTAHVAYRPPPEIDGLHSDLVVCKDSPGKVKLMSKPVGDPTITWSMTGGTITGGQGTDAVTFTADPAWPVDPQLKVVTTYADGACGGISQTPIYVMGDPVIDDLKVTSPVINAGGFSTLTYSWDRNVEYVSFEVVNLHNAADKSRQSDLIQSGHICSDRKCTVSYKDTHGPGDVAIVLHYGGPCNYAVGASTSVTIKIVP